jgi:hypothetical protein
MISAKEARDLSEKYKKEKNEIVTARTTSELLKISDTIKAAAESGSNEIVYIVSIYADLNMTISHLKESGYTIGRNYSTRSFDVSPETLANPRKLTISW